MSDPFVALLMLGLFIVFIFLGFPIAFTMMAMGMGFGFYAYFTPDQLIWDNRILYLFTQNTFSVMNSDILVAIPLFLFMGYMIERSNILDKLFLSLQVGLRFVPGSMAVAALVTPGPAVTAANPGVRVSLPIASAAKTAVCSWRTSMSRMGPSAAACTEVAPPTAASYSGKMCAPDRVKRCRTPWRAAACTAWSPPC